MNTHITRKSIGFILSIATTGALFYWIAWNGKALGEFVASVGGIGNVVLAALGLAALVLSVFWPDGWNEWFRRSLLVVIFVTLLFGGGAVFGAAFEQAPWLTVLGLLGFVLVTALLYSITVLEHPIASWRRLFQRRPVA